MPRPLTQYRIFIGSPGGLEEERRLFRDTIASFNQIHGEPSGVVFAAVGWEDTLPGMGRPQERINEDLRQCDYAVFVLHDRWGTPTGSGKTSGTKEEWDQAQDLYADKSIWHISLFFKQVDPGKLRDPGPQLTSVLRFKDEIKAERRHLFAEYDDAAKFEVALERFLAQWLRDHLNRFGGGSAGSPTPQLFSPDTPIKVQDRGPEPGFAYWLAESQRLADPAEKAFDPRAALVFADRALESAQNDAEWARAENARGVAQYHLNDPQAAIQSFERIVDRLAGSTHHERIAITLVNKGIVLSALGRHEDAIAFYDDVVARFEAADDLQLREQVAKALAGKGFTLSKVGRYSDAIAAYGDVVARFGAAKDLPLCEQVASALVGMGVALGILGRRDDEIATYDDVVARFGTAEALSLRVLVAMALVDKAIGLATLGRNDDAIAVNDDVVARFGTDEALPLREQVARALVGRGYALGRAGRSEDSIAAYDDVVARFGTTEALPLREQVAIALVSKGFRLGELERNEDAIAAYDHVVARFGTAEALPLREQVAMALFNKGFRLEEIERNEDAIAAYNDVIARFGNAEDPPLRERVGKTLMRKSLVLERLGRSEEAGAVDDDIIAKYETAAEPSLQRLVALVQGTRRRRT